MTTWNLEGMKHHLLICNGGSCMRNQGEQVTQAIRDEIARHAGDALIHTTRTRCNGRCEDACVVIHYPKGVWYRKVSPDTGRRIVNGLLSSGDSLKEHVSYTYENKLAAPETPRGFLKIK
ncbi:(2Fe-2S) ferredoxin domain-containing protein [Paenibacillus sp. P26]|nr:(2Fe-2S) ferredoxin domain-containing protein [Paenibacillus sp. P26]